MRGMKLLSVGLVAAVVLGLASAGAASAKGVLEINYAGSGEHVPVGTNVKLLVHATITSKIWERTAIEKTIVEECASISIPGEEAPLAANGAKTDMLGKTAMEGDVHCSGGLSEEHESVFGNVKEVTL